MHSTMVKVRLTSRPDEEVEVSLREADSLARQGLLVKAEKKAAPAAGKDGAK